MNIKLFFNTLLKISSQFFGAKNSHLIAILSTVMLHAGLISWAIYPSDKIVVTQQTIQVNFVAPSSQKQQNERSSHKKLLPIIEQKTALKQQKKTEASSTEKQNVKNQIDRQTSGRSDPNAVAINAAESDPVFDAAYLNNPAPYYPQLAKKRGVQGKVMLDVVVKIDGTPLAIVIAHSSGSSILDQAAIDAVRDWRFVPARRSGRVVQANVIVPVEFKII